MHLIDTLLRGVDSHRIRDNLVGLVPHHRVDIEANNRVGVEHNHRVAHHLRVTAIHLHTMIRFDELIAAISREWSLYDSLGHRIELHRVYREAILRQCIARHRLLRHERIENIILARILLTALQRTCLGLVDLATTTLLALLLDALETCCLLIGNTCTLRLSLGDNRVELYVQQRIFDMLYRVAFCRLYSLKRIAQTLLLHTRCVAQTTTL